MIGITAYGAYIPLFRLDKSVIGGRGEKAICNFDEDSTTMAVEAVNDCLKGQDRQMIDALYFGTTTSLYKEHLGATTIAMASDLKENTYTAEFGNSLRAGIAAFKAGIDSVKAGSARRVVVTAADCRMGTPGSVLERSLGDGAVALVIGDTDVAVTVEGSYSVYKEIIDVWRTNSDGFVRTWEDRFVAEQGYLPAMHQAVTGLMKKFNYKPTDFARVVFDSPDPRRSADLARSLGFDIKTQLQDPLVDVMGNTGAASALMLLVTGLEEAKPGDLILVASYGNGADAFACKVNDNINKLRGQGLGMKGHLASKRVITDYLRYLRWRGIVPLDKPMAPPNVSYSSVAAKREYDRSISLHGSRCKACGYIQYPPQRICTHCRTKDQMESYSFVGKRGKIFTYTLDYITPRAEVPIPTVEVDFEEGGRIQAYMTEVDPDQITVGLPVEMTFRRYTLWEEVGLREGVYLYFWEAKSPRV